MYYRTKCVKCASFSVRLALTGKAYGSIFVGHVLIQLAPKFYQNIAVQTAVILWYTKYIEPQGFQFSINGFSLVVQVKSTQLTTDDSGVAVIGPANELLMGIKDEYGHNLIPILRC